jgi:hypothetical protein
VEKIQEQKGVLLEFLRDCGFAVSG